MDDLDISGRRRGRGGWPHGRPMLSQAYLAERRRERCAQAIADLAHDAGPEKLKVDMVTGRAQMARGTFYDTFAGFEEALRFACDWAGRQLSEPIRDAAGAAEQPGRIGRAVGALLDAASERPSVAELYLVHRPCLLGSDAIEDDVLAAALIAAIDGDRQAGSAPRPEQVADFVAAGILAVVRSRLRAGEAASLPALEGELAQLATASCGTAADAVTVSSL